MEISLEYVPHFLNSLDKSYADKFTYQENVQVSSLIDEDTYNSIVDKMSTSKFFNIAAAAEYSRDAYKKLKIAYIFPELKLALIDGKPKSIYCFVKDAVMCHLGYTCFTSAKDRSPLYFKELAKFLYDALPLTSEDKFLIKLVESEIPFSAFKELLNAWSDLGASTTNQNFLERCEEVSE